MNDSGHDNPAFTEERVVIPVEESKKAITYSWYGVNVFAKPEKHLFKSTKAPKEEKHILRNVDGICHPSELVAIMGASGAGKTTLLNVLASRSSKALRIEGDLYVNGEKLNPVELTSQSAYVQQEDLFVGTCTVREQLVFQAHLRMDRHISKEMRLKRVEEVMSQMGLKKCSETLIGIPGRIKGISGGETKRLAFACEVLTDPPLMLCDEPTTGLDSFMAQTIVSAMKTLAGQQKTIISTIHQPSSEVFAMFDRVLLMAEGRLAFLGHRLDAQEFFNRFGKRCPKNYNPADFFIASLAIEPDREKECREFVEKACDTFEGSELSKELEVEIRKNMKHAPPESKSIFTRSKKEKKSPYKAGFLVQFGALTKRGFQEVTRDPQLLRIKVIQTVMISLLIGIIYLDLDYGEYDQAKVQNINGAIFLILTNLSFQFVFGVINTFCGQLPVFLREHHSGMYTTNAFYLTKNLAEFPGSVILPLLFLLCLYFLINLYRSASAFFIMTIALILCSNCGLSFGYMISCIASNLNMALAIAAPMIIPLMLFGGYFLNSDSVPYYFIWLQYLSWFFFADEAMLIAQWRDVDEIECDDPTSPFCYQSGQEVLAAYGYDEDNLGIDFLALILLTLLYRACGFFILLYKAYTMR